MLATLNYKQNYDEPTPRQEAVKRKVLMIENDYGTQDRLIRVLEAIDPEIRIEWASTAEEAEEILNENRGSHSLVFCDLILPGVLNGMDLWEFCEHKYPDLPFVLTSDFGPHQFMEWVGQNRVCPFFLQKPIQLEDCKEILEGILESEEETL